VNVVSTAPAILVTGGASGIGFAIVEAILAEGWRAIAADVSEANLASSRKKLGDRPDLRVVWLDVADEDAVVKTVAVCEREFGPLSGIVNSAGIARDIPALETSAKTFREVLDVNLIGSFLAAKRPRRCAGAAPAPSSTWPRYPVLSAIKAARPMAPQKVASSS